MKTLFIAVRIAILMFMAASVGWSADNEPDVSLAEGTATVSTIQFALDSIDSPPHFEVIFRLKFNNLDQKQLQDVIKRLSKDISQTCDFKFEIKPVE